MFGKIIQFLKKPLLCVFIVPGLLASNYDGTQINDNLNAASVPDHVVLTWTGDPGSSQTITWRSAAAINSGEVQYREAENSKAGYLSEKAAVKKFSTVTGDKPGSFNIFSVTLKGLKPDTRYVYRVISGTVPGQENSFSTGVTENEPFTFLIFGDSQSGDNNPIFSPWHETVAKAYAAHPEARFMINMGDLTETGMSYIHWDNWFSAAKDVLSRIPEMPIIGNHESVGETTAANSAKPLYYLEQFPLFQNGPKDLKGEAYSYDYGNLHITVLNSEEVYSKDEVSRSQLNWLEQDLAASNKTWKLVFFHRAPFYNRAARSNEMVKKTFCPIIDKYHVDVVFNGHEHGIARTYPIRQEKMYSTPKDGTVYYTTGRSGNSVYNDLTKKFWDAFFYDPQDQPCYETVQVNKNTLTINAYKQDGTLIDSYTIDKENNAKSSLTPAPARYEVTHFVIYGDLFTGPAAGNARTAKKVDDKWFVNAKVFMGSIGGGAALSSQKVELFYETRSLKVPPEKVEITEKKIVYIPVDLIKQFVGFDYYYDEALNVLFFTK